MASSTTSSNFEHVVAEEPAQGSSPAEQQTNTGAASPNGAKGRATNSRRRKKQYVACEDARYRCLLFPGTPGTNS